MLETDKLTSLEPNDIELEKSILYCLLYNKDLQHKIFKIEADDFYDRSNKEIFLEFRKIIEKGKEVIPEVVSSELKHNRRYLEIVTHTAMASNFPDYFKKFKEVSDTRKIQKIAYGVAIKVKENRNPKEIRSWAVGELEKVRSYSDIDFKKQTEEIDLVFENMLNNSNLVSIKTGYPRLDKITKGFLRGSLNIIASAQGIGKSSWILNVINHICYKQKKRVLFVSIELDYDILHGKMISLISGVSFQKLMFESKTMSKEEWQKVNNARAQVSEYNLYRIGEDKITPVDIEDTLKEIKNIDIVFIDYLQLMKPNAEGKTIRERITNLSGELKMLARKTGIPIVAISSINREYSRRDSKEPRISDLRESGNLEFDAGTVLLLHRACKYRDANYAKGEDPEEFEKEAELIVAKNRFGEDSLKIDFYFDGARGFFGETYKEGHIEKIKQEEKEYRDFNEPKDTLDFGGDND